jgi:hypothetical protein
MTFAETFVRINQKLDRQDQIVDLEKRRATYRHFREQIDFRKLSISDLLKRIQVFREGELPLEDVNPLLESLVREIEQLQQDWKASPIRVLQEPDRFDRLRELEEIIESTLESIYEQIQQYWQSDALPAYYSVLTRNTSLRPLVEKVQSIDADLPRLLPESMPSEANRLTRAKRLKTERDQVKTEIDKAIPIELRELFAKISKGDATLADLTPSVLQQLQEFQADRAVRLMFR